MEREAVYYDKLCVEVRHIVCEKMYFHFLNCVCVRVCKLFLCVNPCVHFVKKIYSLCMIFK